MKIHQKYFEQILNKVKKHTESIIGLDNSNYIFSLLGTGEPFLKTICMLPIWFNESFKGTIDIKTKHLKLLGEANLKAWLAYTIYDYLRDGKISKDKNTLTISIANIYANESILFFYKSAKNNLEIKLIQDLFNKIDLFYLKNEETNFKDLTLKISDKSIAASIAAILAVPYKISSLKVNKQIIDFFKHYFTARQLSDDLDDYKKDLKLKITTPPTLLLRKGLSFREMHSEIRSLIESNLLYAEKNLKMLPNFNAESFGKKFIKPC